MNQLAIQNCDLDINDLEAHLGWKVSLSFAKCQTESTENFERKAKHIQSSWLSHLRVEVMVLKQFGTVTRETQYSSSHHPWCNTLAHPCHTVPLNYILVPILIFAHSGPDVSALHISLCSLRYSPRLTCFKPHTMHSTQCFIVECKICRSSRCQCCSLAAAAV